MMPAHYIIRDLRVLPTPRPSIVFLRSARHSWPDLPSRLVTQSLGPALSASYLHRFDAFPCQSNFSPSAPPT